MACVLGTLLGAVDRTAAENSSSVCHGTYIPEFQQSLQSLLFISLEEEEDNGSVGSFLGQV